MGNTSDFAHSAVIGEQRVKCRLVDLSRRGLQSTGSNWDCSLQIAR
jgi:hypothetical protein